MSKTITKSRVEEFNARATALKKEIFPIFDRVMLQLTNSDYSQIDKLLTDANEAFIVSKTAMIGDELWLENGEAYLSGKGEIMKIKSKDAPAETGKLAKPFFERAINHLMGNCRAVIAGKKINYKSDTDWQPAVLEAV